MPANSLLLPPGAMTGIGSLSFRDPYVAVQVVKQVCPLVPSWPELLRCSLEARSIEQTLSAFADLVRPRCNDSRYEVMPSRLATLLERLDQVPAHLERSICVYQHRHSVGVLEAFFWVFRLLLIGCGLYCRCKSQSRQHNLSTQPRTEVLSHVPSRRSSWAQVGMEIDGSCCAGALRSHDGYRNREGRRSTSVRCAARHTVSHSAPFFLQRIRYLHEGE